MNIYNSSLQPQSHSGEFKQRMLQHTHKPVVCTYMTSVRVESAAAHYHKACNDAQTIPEGTLFPFAIHIYGSYVFACLAKLSIRIVLRHCGTHQMAQSTWLPALWAGVMSKYTHICIKASNRPDDRAPHQINQSSQTCWHVLQQQDEMTNSTSSNI